MLQIQVLGPSCGKCIRLESMVTDVLTELGITDAQLDKIADPRIIEQYLIEDPPGLLINDTLYWAGGDLPERAQLRTWIGELVGASHEAK